MRVIASLLAVCAILFGTPCAGQPAWKPERAIEIVVVSAPGGGNDWKANS